ncbi:hypothetical protein Ddye_004440 [Dipteronia dyeriana]|uniref:Uncharacterized protein n=1 Tax=Dipteronia dyeriana TaxID=168575 RepID=A0AAD9XU75_9ROSI|nr:hypothetical protein Ddye_004440 [Dipteronia dyeriana]
MSLANAFQVALSTTLYALSSSPFTIFYYFGRRSGGNAGDKAKRDAAANQEMIDSALRSPKFNCVFFKVYSLTHTVGL